MRGAAEPCLLAYDIAHRRRLQRVGRVLAHWRIGGQKSVHECLLRPHEQIDLLAEVAELIQPEQDSVLLVRLPWGEGGPSVAGVPSWRPGQPDLLDWRVAAPLPWPQTQAWTLLAYDVRDARRLRRAHALLAAVATPLQRSLFLHFGAGAELASLLVRMTKILGDEDDLRLYRLGHPRRLWWLCGGIPLSDAELGPPRIPSDTLIWYGP
ncbi:MAG: hypothetical protein HZB71_11300 [Betaproteobacteria bacterium]|nr:hypothetical protein [Betaproteobacteria bacterium]